MRALSACCIFSRPDTETHAHTRERERPPIDNDNRCRIASRPVKIAFVGKGGSGKTTLGRRCSPATSPRPGHRCSPSTPTSTSTSAVALGADDGPPPRAAQRCRPAWIKDHLRGTNPRIAAADAMIKTTPPGRGSRLLRLARRRRGLRPPRRDAVRGVPLVVTGEFDEADLGVACYHSKTGAVELYLNHLVDGPGEYVVVDMTAGADAFASGLFTRFDLTVLVSEPTRRGVGVYRQYAEHAADYGVALRRARQQGHRSRRRGLPARAGRATRCSARSGSSACACGPRERGGAAGRRRAGAGEPRRPRRRCAPRSTPAPRPGRLPPRHRRLPPAQRRRLGQPRHRRATSPTRSTPTSPIPCPSPASHQR